MLVKIWFFEDLFHQFLLMEFLLLQIIECIFRMNDCHWLKIFRKIWFWFQSYSKLETLQLDLTAHQNDEEPGCENGELMPGVYCGTQGNVQPNGEFVLERYYAIKHEVVYSCCPNKYPDLTYYVLLRRRPMFYVFNLILPCVLINSIGKIYLRV